MPFTYERTIRLAETDAAGILFFARYLMLCHEAYEAALSEAGMPVHEFIVGGDVLIPISRSQAEYLRPLACGDRVRIDLAPSRLSDSSFAIDYTLIRLSETSKTAARARTEHVCTSRSQRTRAPLSPSLAAWVDTG